MSAYLSRRIDDLEPELTRHGYDVRTLCDQSDAEAVEIRQLMRGNLNPQRTTELIDEMRTAGPPCDPFPAICACVSRSCVRLTQCGLRLNQSASAGEFRLKYSAPETALWDVSRNRRNFRHPKSNPATRSSKSIIFPSLWKV